jgi:hypothetical protein
LEGFANALSSEGGVAFGVKAVTKAVMILTPILMVKMV